MSRGLGDVYKRQRFVYLPNISVFLSYFKHCKYLITDSFHGTSFALNFNKQFQVILCKDNTGSRILSVLKLTGLENRLTHDLSDLDTIYGDTIDYDRVNAIIAREREESYKILKSIL